MILPQAVDGMKQNNLLQLPQSFGAHLFFPGTVVLAHEFLQAFA